MTFFSITIFYVGYISLELVFLLSVGKVKKKVGHECSLSVLHVPFQNFFLPNLMERVAIVFLADLTQCHFVRLENVTRAKKKKKEKEKRLHQKRVANLYVPHFSLSVRITYTVFFRFSNNI